MQHQQPEQPGQQQQQQHRHQTQHISKHHQLMRTFGYGQDKKSYLPLWMLNAKGGMGPGGDCGVIIIIVISITSIDKEY